jgi:hypothetical protein
VHPVKGPFDHAFTPKPERPAEFLGSLREHLSANFRAYDYRQNKENGDENKASVLGGSVSFHTGLWNDLLGGGATVYTSQKLWGPNQNGGTGLLEDNQQSFTVLGEIYGELDFDWATASAGRRTMDLPYINKEDIRQVPITHEAIMLERRGTEHDFAIGHVTQIKLRDEDSFASMADSVGVLNKDRGVSVVGFQLDLPQDLRFGAITQYGRDLFNTVYTDVMWDREFTSGYSLHLGAQFTDQRSVGDELLGNYDAQAWGLRTKLGRGGQGLELGYANYSDDGIIRRNYGATPNFNAMIIQKFDQPGEQSVGAHYSSNFKGVGLPAWGINLGVVSGWDIVDADTGASQADEVEYNMTLDYKPKSGALNGLWIRLRYIYVDFDSGVGHRWNTRLIVNYKIPGLR